MRLYHKFLFAHKDTFTNITISKYKDTVKTITIEALSNISLKLRQYKKNLHKSLIKIRVLHWKKRKCILCCFKI